MGTVPAMTRGIMVDANIMRIEITAIKEANMNMCAAWSVELADIMAMPAQEKP